MKSTDIYPGDIVKFWEPYIDPMFDPLNPEVCQMAAATKARYDKYFQEYQKTGTVPVFTSVDDNPNRNPKFDNKPKNLLDGSPGARGVATILKR